MLQARPRAWRPFAYGGRCSSPPLRTSCTLRWRISSSRQAALCRPLTCIEPHPNRSSSLLHDACPLTLPLPILAHRAVQAGDRRGVAWAEVERVLFALESIQRCVAAGRGASCAPMPCMLTQTACCALGYSGQGNGRWLSTGCCELV